MIDKRKKAVSIRLNAADVRKMKKLAQRLGVRESDVIRFAVKCMLARLGPLYDPDVRGRNLVPVFVEAGGDLLRFFELDSARLEAIVNEDVEPARRVDRGDLALLALTGAPEPYAALMLSELSQTERSGRGDATELSSSLRQYLYDKYVYRGSAEATPEPEPMRLAVAGGQRE